MTHSHYKDPEKRREYERQWRAANRERYLEAMRQWRLANPEKVKEHNDTWWRENREQHYANSKQWRDGNPEKIKAAGQRDRATHKDRVRRNQRDWTIANPEKAKAISKKWKEANPDKLLEMWRRRRARELNAPGVFTAADWETLVSRSPRCHWCKRPFNKTRRPTHDHVIPLVLEGENSPANSVCACQSCNSSKGARLINPATRESVLL